MTSISINNSNIYSISSSSSISSSVGGKEMWLATTAVSPNLRQVSWRLEKVTSLCCHVTCLECCSADDGIASASYFLFESKRLVEFRYPFRSWQQEINIWPRSWGREIRHARFSWNCVIHIKLLEAVPGGCILKRLFDEQNFGLLKSIGLVAYRHSDS